jgi:adenylate cyclase
LGPEVNGADVRPRRPHALLLLLPILLLVAWVAASPTARQLDARLHDQITRALPAAAPPPGVVMVDIDEASLAQLGPWPWSRPVLAELARRLRERGAILQVWDLFLPEPAPGDEAFNAVLSGPDIVLGQVLIVDPQVQSPPRQGTLRPDAGAPPICAPHQQVSGHFGVADTLPGAFVGHVSATPDVDGALRRLPAVVCQGSARFPQLTLAAAQRLQPDAPWQLQPGGPLLGPAQWLVRGPLRFALDGENHLPVPYRRPHTQWPALSALQLLEDARSPAVPAAPATAGAPATPAPPSVKGQIVVLGATALGLADTVTTPFHATAPGVSVHAELLAAALDGQWTVAPARPGLYAALLVAALGGLLAVALPLLQRQALLWSVGLVAALLPAGVAVAARLHGAQLPLAAPTLGLLLFGFALGGLHVQAARRQARTLVRHLESFLPPNLAREIVRQNPSSDSLGRPETGVVLALRVVGLERWSAAADSLKALGLVHAISSLAEKHARQHGGTLQHLQGDTLLLAWPVPEAGQGGRGEHTVTLHLAYPANPAHPANPASSSALQHAVQQAVLAARGLFVELGALLSTTETERYPLGLRAAVETGPYLLAVAGSSASRRSLMLGPAVDVALALLPLCDELASPLLLGQRAAAAQPRLALQPMGSFLLPDSGQPQTVSRVQP